MSAAVVAANPRVSILPHTRPGLKDILAYSLGQHAVLEPIEPIKGTNKPFAKMSCRITHHVARPVRFSQ